jgi:undecaprenyl-diphosphatase
VTATQGLLLGLIQGITEFLPVSSSGHLILVPRLLGWPDQGLAFDAVIHLGTLVALVAYFKDELWEMAVGLVTAAGEGRRLFGLLVLGTIPAGIVGAVAGKSIEAHLRQPVVVASSLIGWAIIMWIVDYSTSRGGQKIARIMEVRWKQSLLVGLAQAIALIPGTSRSGVTITAGQISRMDRAMAARFSFLLGIPITAAAGSVKALELLRHGVPAGDTTPLLLGLVAAAASGFAAVWFLVGYLQGHSLTVFVIYRIILGGIILLLLG